jgi:NADH:ubiquinone oxidoreductase subunit E
MSSCANPATVQPTDLTLHSVRARIARYAPAEAELKRSYPTRRAVLLQVLHLAQQEFGCVPRVAIEWAADVSECSPVHAFSVVEFYTMYRQVPKGRFLIQICQTMCCHIQGSEDLIAHVEKKLGIHAGGTTEDHLFSLVRVECLALCGSGPGVMIDDQAIGPVPHALGSGKLAGQEGLESVERDSRSEALEEKTAIDVGIHGKVISVISLLVKRDYVRNPFKQLTYSRTYERGIRATRRAFSHPLPANAHGRRHPGSPFR